MFRLTAQRSMILVVLILGGFFVVSFAFLNLQGNSSIPEKPRTAEQTEIPTPPALAPAAEATVKSFAAALGDSQPEISSNSNGSPAVEIKNFQRSESKNGKLAWELAGSAARYELGGSQVAIKNAKVTTRLSNGTLATLQTPDAQVSMSGATLNEARGTGGVKITLDSGITVTTDTAKFERSTGKVSSPTPITILHPQGSLTANSFSGDTARGMFVFVGKVQTTILPKEKK